MRNKAKRIVKEVLRQYSFLFSHQDVVIVVKSFAIRHENDKATWRKQLIEVCLWLSHFIVKKVAN